MRGALSPLLILVTALGAHAAWGQAPSDGGFAASLSTKPERVVLGEVKRVVFQVEAAEAPGPLRPLRASVNVGRLGTVERLESGRYEIAYTPPKKKYPQVAIVAVWRETGPEAPVAFFRVPLHGTARVPVETAPRAKVTVDVGDNVFGPFQADASGRALLKLVVPPGVPRATITAVDARGKSTSTDLVLDVPPYNRLTLAVVPHAIVADGHGEARLHVYYDAVGGKSPRPSDVRIETAVGSVSGVRHAGGPIFVASFTAPPGTPDQKVAFGTRVQSDRVSGARASITLGRQKPSQVELELLPGTLIADGRRATEARVLLLDALGLGVPGAQVQIEAELPEGGTVGATRDLGQGAYAAELRPGRLEGEASPRTVAVRARAERFAAEATLRLDPYVPAAVTVDPESVELDADGRAESVLTVRVADAGGEAMTSVVPGGEAGLGSLGEAEREGEVFRLRYRAPLLTVKVADRRTTVPAREDLVSVRAGGIEGSARIRLAPTVQVMAPRLGYVELLGGWASNLQGLSGPLASVALGVDVTGGGRIGLGLGIAWSAGLRRGLLDLGSEGPSHVRLLAAPLLGEARLILRGTWWRLNLGAGAGVVLLPGEVALPSSGRLPVNDQVLGLGARLGLAARAGPGFLVLEATWLHAVRREDPSGLEINGSMGGPGLGLGYRLEH